MPRFDLDLADLREYRPDVRCPADLWAFWDAQMAAARAAGAAVSVTAVDSSLTTLDVFDVRFPGYGGEPVAGWLLLPRFAAGPLPGVVEYVGYGGGRGEPYDHLQWPSAGFATLVMDNRGQGGLWSAPGVTPDPHGTGPSSPGFLTRGIESAETLYYVRLLVDAARAVDFLAGHDGVDGARVVTTGGSQGGALALAAAALAPAAAVAADVPFLCHFERAVGLTGNEPYEEVARYLGVHRGARDSVFDVLAYVDVVNLAARIGVPALVSVGLFDVTCPPSTVFAAANRIPGAEIDVYEYNGHEGGATYHWARKVEWARKVLG